MNINMEMVLESNLDSKDLVIIGLLDTISREKGSDVFECSYGEIISALPVIFKSKSFKANSVKARRILDKEGVKKFITRDIDKRGRGVGSIITFTINRRMVDNLGVKGIVK